MFKWCSSSGIRPFHGGWMPFLLNPWREGHTDTLPDFNSPNLNAGSAWKQMSWQEGYLCLTLALNAEPKEISFH